MKICAENNFFVKEIKLKERVKKSEKFIVIWDRNILIIFLES